MHRKHWQCTGCGAIHIKDEAKQEVTEALLQQGLDVEGGETCTECGTRHSVSEVYGGTHDMLAPDDLVARMLADPEGATWDASTRTFVYRGTHVNGSLELPRFDGHLPEPDIAGEEVSSVKEETVVYSGVQAGGGSAGE